jgi:hypothetical protein
MTGNPEEQALSSTAAESSTKMNASLAAFDRHKDDLLAMLQDVCERKPKTKSFDKNETWRHLGFWALFYLQEQARVEQERMELAPDRLKLLLQLENTLKEARCKLDEATHHDIRGVLFWEWCCETYDNPDFTEFLELLGNEFDKNVAGVVAGLGALERAASRAEQVGRRKPGRPSGTSLLSPEFIITLESIYRRSTGKSGKVGAGPFARFVHKFSEAMGHRSNKEESVIRAIKAAKKREEADPATSRWGRESPNDENTKMWEQWLLRVRARMEGKIPPNSP